MGIGGDPAMLVNSVDLFWLQAAGCSFEPVLLGLASKPHMQRGGPIPVSLVSRQIRIALEVHYRRESFAQVLEGYSRYKFVMKP
jgi:hypothetical protein